MKFKTFALCAIASAGIAAASPAYAGTPKFCPSVNSAPYSFYWWLSSHLPQGALDALFGPGGACSR